MPKNAGVIEKVIFLNNLNNLENKKIRKRKSLKTKVLRVEQDTDEKV